MQIASLEYIPIADVLLILRKIIDVKSNYIIYISIIEVTLGALYVNCRMVV